MRVISGELKGRRLQTCREKFLRPTSEKVREAVFNILSPFLTGGLVLDLFAGTGSLGVEALSRGMDRTIFVENNPRVVAILKKNISNCGIENRAEVISLSTSRALKILKAHDERFKLIFLDPPYQENLAGKTLLEIGAAKVLTVDGIVTVEHSSKEVLESVYGNLRRDDQRKYGQTLVSFFTPLEKFREEARGK